VSIEQGQKWGTAWLADGPERLLVTNHHVVAPTDLSLLVLPDAKIKVLFPESRDGRPVNEKEVALKDGKTYQVRVVDFDLLRDLAVLQLVSNLPQGTEPLPLARESCEQGDIVHSLGNPVGDALWVYNSGTVRQVYLKNQKIPGFKNLTRMRYQCVETQSPLNPGDSGGPVINDDGELIAVNESRTISENGVISLQSFAIDVSEVRAYLDEVRPMLHPRSAADFERRGLRYIAKGRYSEAISDFDETMKRGSPVEARSNVLLNRARAYALRADALRYAESEPPLVLNPARANAWRVDRAKLRADRDEGIQDLTEALSSKPSDPELLVLRGELYLKAGNTSAARADFEGAINSAAGKSSNSKALSKACFFQQMMLPEQDRARKVELLNKAIRLDPQNFQYRLVRGVRLDEMGQVLLALVDTQKAISLFAEENDLAKWAEIVPEIRDAFHNLAHILYQLKKPEEALKSYTVAVDLSWKTRPHTKEEAKFVVHIGREMFSFLNAPDDAKKAFNVAEKMSPAVTAERSSFNEKLLYFVNKSQTKLVLAIKYHTLGKDNQWRWLPGDLTTADAANQTIGPGESAFLAVKEKGRIQADRVRLFLWSDKNEVVSDQYWKQDLVLVEQPYQGYMLERFTFSWP